MTFYNALKVLIERVSSGNLVLTSKCDTCSINDATGIIDPCNHAICDQCINEKIITKRHMCPICKDVVKYRGIRR